MSKKVLNKGSNCVDCNRKVSFANSEPAAGKNGRRHKLGLGCRKDECVPTVVPTKKVKPSMASFQDMLDYANGVQRLSSGLEFKPRSVHMAQRSAPREPLDQTTNIGKLKFVPKSIVASQGQSQ